MISRGWVTALGWLCVFFGTAPIGLPAEQPPWQDATAVWHFDRATDQREQYPLRTRGEVSLGELLTADQRSASLARGGDGKVARLSGGYLEIDGPSLDPPTACFTLLMRLRDPQGEWNAPLFGSYGGDGTVSLYLRGVDGATLPQRDQNFVGDAMATPASWMFGWPNGPRAIRGSRGVVEFLWGAREGAPLTPARRHMLPKNVSPGDEPPLLHDAMAGVMRLMFPMQPADPRVWHDIIIRGTEAKLQLWLDGVLVDEEFSIGVTRPASVPRYFAAAQTADGDVQSGFHGEIDHAAIWHRALTEGEIEQLSGGLEHVRQRELAILGPLPQTMQYYRPRGHNSKAGDCIPYFHDGTFHLFYLILRRNMHSKWDGGHGGLEIHHASTRNLTHWTHHPVSVPITEQWEAWQGTGGVVHHDDKFWMFYPTPDYDGRRGGIQLATSEDGEVFTKHPSHPFLAGGDCDVFADPDPARNVFHLLKAGESFGSGLPELKDKTLICWASPADLEQRGAGLLTVEGTGGQFDSLVLGEAVPGRWMAGSDNFRRTQRDQQNNAAETAKPGEFVKLAAVYRGNTVTLYRNGVQYACYEIAQPLHFPPGARVIVGLRHMDRWSDPAAHFRGQIADARVYDRALSEEEIHSLRPHERGAIQPTVWFDFQQGVDDLGGTLTPGELHAGAQLSDGALVLHGNQDCLVSGGRKAVLAHWISEDLTHWQELPEPFLVTDENMVPQMCPHWFQWNDWYYFIGGVGGIWRSRQPFGPWTLQTPRPLDNLAVPKTGAFSGNRRILAGFLGDGGWGGNLVLRELVQHSDGHLGTRFVPELLPASSDPIEQPGVTTPLRIAAATGRQQMLLEDIPHDAKISLKLELEGAVTAFGLRLRTTDGQQDGTDLSFTPASASVSFSHSTHSGSGGPLPGGPAIAGVQQDHGLQIDIVCRHDIVDVEMNGEHTLANRYWNPEARRLAIWVEGGTITVQDLVVRPWSDRTSPGVRPGNGSR